MINETTIQYIFCWDEGRADLPLTFCNVLTVEEGGVAELQPGPLHSDVLQAAAQTRPARIGHIHGLINNIVTKSSAWLDHGVTHGLINYRDTKVKCRNLRKLTCKGTLRQFLSVWGPLPSYDPIPPIFTLYTWILYTYSHREGGESWTREVRGATIHQAGSNIPTWLNGSPVYKLW
jgi:hypothetical protein